jgi:microsomal epoxide hydrolase
MAKNFGVPPRNNPAKLEAFTLRVSDDALAEFRELVRLSKIGPATWWNQYDDHRFGVSRKWMSDAKEAWLTTFDWRKHEERINSFPNFKTTVQDPEAGEMEIHFAALFSAREDAVPVIFMHGFPSAFTDFLPMMRLLADKYTPETLPYHVVVPSLPDYGLSGGPSRNVETTLDMAARIMNQLMIDLGFGDGYVAQGGDLGCWIARLLSANHKECKAFHREY